MNRVRYPFINMGQEKRTSQTLWKYVEKAGATEMVLRDLRVMGIAATVNHDAAGHA